MLHIFPTSRLIREFYSTYNNAFLPQACSISEFESKALVVPNLALATNENKILIMQEACRFENFKKLHIPDEFLAFLNNSSYLFRFFEELSVELKSCDDLLFSDTYAEYLEHIDILKTLLQRYEELLLQKGLYDRITLPKLYHLNEQYIKKFSQINLHVEGILSKFEFKVFCEISKFTQVNILLHVNKYSKKMCEFFNDFDKALPQNSHVSINLNKKTFTKIKQEANIPKIVVKDFSLRSLQAGYIFEQISLYINQGYEPEEIVVVLPDENFASLLKSYDYVNNLNLAMGYNFSECEGYQKLHALMLSVSDESVKVLHLIARFELNEFTHVLKKQWNKYLKYEEFESLINSFSLSFTNEQKAIFEKNMYLIKTLLKNINLKCFEIIRLLLQNLKQEKLDDTHGGRVLVVGVLETRGLNYKCVIVPDFNDEFIPKTSQKDMFLSSHIRKKADLPTAKDREDLQRYFYYQIIQNAQKVSICYVENETSIKSRFLQNLQTHNDTRFDQNSYSTLLFKSKPQKQMYKSDDLFDKNTIFDKPISSSRLKSFLTCKRAYYFKYVLKIKEDEIPDDTLKSKDIGIFLHECLQEIYQNGLNFSSEKDLHVKLCDVLDTKKHKHSAWLLQKHVWKQRLFHFCENEMKRFYNGYVPYVFEKSFQGEFNGVKIEGKIDRIDKDKYGKICVIDYKSAKINQVELKDIEKMSDFQLQFYNLLASNLGEVSECGYYELLSANVYNEIFMQEKLDRLKYIFDTIKMQETINFTIDECKYSPYKILLGK